MNPDQQSNYWKPDQEPTEALPVAQPTTIDTIEAETLPQELNDTPQAAPAAVLPEEAISWQASEYIHQERNTGWFVGVIAASVVLLVVAVFLMKSLSFAILIVVMNIALIVLAKRPPRILKYTLSNKGVYVADVLHGLSEYKAFGIIRDEGEYSVMLIPTKRFSPGLTIYFPVDMGEKIVDFLGKRLPMQELKLDLVDRLVRKLRL